jgi:hypothetical protein
VKREIFMPQIRRPSETWVGFGFVFDKIEGKCLILFFSEQTGSTQVM